MKLRSSLEICLPLAVFVAACALSIPTLVLALIWLTIGVCSIGHRALNDFPTADIPRRWLRGPRRGCLWFYHLAWWPRYTPVNLRALAGRPSKAGKAVR
ncbi:hypothetical protein [Paraburkholderia ferrariae]|uniref:hypothetical protein n=1 Tax=Paraburkholderia ferrariae TaxID=386056 RepID=UPI000485B90F|nr:hypothetical protein [Paraburkholderia ferrariae]